MLAVRIVQRLNLFLPVVLMLAKAVTERNGESVFLPFSFVVDLRVRSCGGEMPSTELHKYKLEELRRELMAAIGEDACLYSVRHGSIFNEALRNERGSCIYICRAPVNLDNIYIMPQSMVLDSSA